MSIKITLILPLAVYLPRKTKDDKKFILNLNNYSNIHYLSLNQAKIEYKARVEEALKLTDWDKKKYEKVKVELLYFHGNKRRIDKSNPCTVIEKFACDALTDLGVWDDDDSEHIPITTYEFGGIDKHFPRCELSITEI